MLYPYGKDSAQPTKGNMTITYPRDTLLAVVAYMMRSGALLKKLTTPVLGYVKLDSGRITATNLDWALTYALPLDAHADFLLPAAELIELLKRADPRSAITFYFDADKPPALIKAVFSVRGRVTSFDREDVAARAIQTKRQAGATNLAKPLDSLIRSDYILARNVLAIVQEFYTEERIITITKDRLTGESEQVTINEATPEGTIANDLTIGEYDVIVSSTPVRESLEDSQFEHAVQLRELGVQIPDSVLIESSRLQRKTEIAKLMQGDKDSEEGQRRAAGRRWSSRTACRPS